MKRTVRRLFCMFLVLVMFASFAPVMSVSAAPAGDRLTGLNKVIYDFLKEQIISVAKGDQTVAEFTLNDPDGIVTWTKQELGVYSIVSYGSVTYEAQRAFSNMLDRTIDLGLINDCLLVDFPYELYWYDKVEGVRYTYNYNANSNEMSLTKIVFNFAVSNDYAWGRYSTNPYSVEATSAAVKNAKAIVKKHASKSDMEKLVAYKDEICNLTDYNDWAANSYYTPYGDPWQLIYVFDKDPTTNVVCEGYAKAFKYLCDLSTFDGDVYCYLVDGYMQGGTGAGDHMWNVVQINGGTYMVDVTNCDEGSIGAPDELFMMVGKKTGNSYAFEAGGSTLYYTYDSDQYDLQTDGYLELKPSTASKYPSGNTLYKMNGKWYHVKGGKIVKDTTLVKYNGEWYYVKDGVKNNANTLVKYNGKWYHVKDGKWVKDTTLVKYNGTWYYVKDGVKNNANTMVKYNGKWYHVKDGKWVKDTTLVKYNGTWYYVKDGVKNSANTMVKYNGKWYHVNGGKKVSDTTLVKYNGTWYYVKDGVKNSANTLVKYNGKWYHVDDGKWVKDTTLVKYNGKWYYVKSGVVDFTFSGRVRYNGKTYKVKNGVKI